MSGAWIGRRAPLLQRTPPRIKVPRKLENEIGEAHHPQIGADRETEKGHPNVTSARDMDTS